MISAYSSPVARQGSPAGPSTAASTPPERVRAHIVATAELPSEFGRFRALVFHNDRDSFEHVDEGVAFGLIDLRPYWERMIQSTD